MLFEKTCLKHLLKKSIKQYNGLHVKQQHLHIISDIIITIIKYILAEKKTIASTVKYFHLKNTFMQRKLIIFY
jgi:hypothetical protein